MRSCSSNGMTSCGSPSSVRYFSARAIIVGYLKSHSTVILQILYFLTIKPPNHTIRRTQYTPGAFYSALETELLPLALAEVYLDAGVAVSIERTAVLHSFSGKTAGSDDILSRERCDLYFRSGICLFHHCILLCQPFAIIGSILMVMLPHSGSTFRNFIAT